MELLEFYVKVGHMLKKGVFYSTTLDSTSLQVPKKMPRFPIFREVWVLLLGFSLCDLLNKNS